MSNQENLSVQEKQIILAQIKEDYLKSTIEANTNRERNKEAMQSLAKYTEKLREFEKEADFYIIPDIKADIQGLLEIDLHELEEDESLKLLASLKLESMWHAATDLLKRIDEQ